MLNLVLCVLSKKERHSDYRFTRGGRGKWPYFELVLGHWDVEGDPSQDM